MFLSTKSKKSLNHDCVTFPSMYFDPSNLIMTSSMRRWTSTSEKSKPSPLTKTLMVNAYSLKNLKMNCEFGLKLIKCPYFILYCIQASISVCVLSSLKTFQKCSLHFRCVQICLAILTPVLTETLLSFALIFKPIFFSHWNLFYDFWRLFKYVML